MDDDSNFDLPLVWGPPPASTQRPVNVIHRKMQWYADQARQHPGETLRIDNKAVFGEDQITTNRAQYWRAHRVFQDGFQVKSMANVLYVTYVGEHQKPAKRAPAKRGVKAAETKQPVRRVRKGRGGNQDQAPTAQAS